MDDTIEHIRSAFEQLGLLEGIVKTQDIAQLTFKSKWHQSVVWHTYACQLDDTNIYYFLPDRFQALYRLTSEYYDYVVVNTGDIQLFVVGLCSKKQPFAPFWTNTMTKNLVQYLPTLSMQAMYELRFALCLEKDLEDVGTYTHLLHFEQAWNDCRRYQLTHRKYVVAVGKALNIPMESHDLTKNRIVQIALAYLWHWKEDYGVQNSTLYNLAQDVVKQNHTMLEPHHPEFGPGFNTDEMFCDRIAVRIQKQPAVLEANGFDLHEKFIPEQCKDAWRKFKAEYSHIDLYKAIDSTKK